MIGTVNDNCKVGWLCEKSMKDRYDTFLCKIIKIDGVPIIYI